MEDDLLLRNTRLVKRLVTSIISIKVVATPAITMIAVQV
jgi:hypothetical protein